jgi:hypothetical protein
VQNLASSVRWVEGLRVKIVDFRGIKNQSHTQLYRFLNSV